MKKQILVDAETGLKFYAEFTAGSETPMITTNAAKLGIDDKKELEIFHRNMGEILKLTNAKIYSPEELFK